MASATTPGTRELKL
jgi:hypothetical protein